MTGSKQVIKELEKLKDKNKQEILARFFKTGKGEYGEGDIFWGISVPAQRRISQKYLGISLKDIAKLLNHPIHEVRLTGTLILVEGYKRAKNNKLEKKEIFEFYLKNIKKLNNWDLIDLSVYKIFGDYLFNNISIIKRKNILKKLALSNNIWERRAAIVSTYYFIKQGRYQETFYISDILLSDREDLIHKAVGWMLREVGKRSSEDALLLYLNKNYSKMARVTLRYAIERLDEKTRKHYLNKGKEGRG